MTLFGDIVDAFRDAEYVFGGVAVTFVYPDGTQVVSLQAIPMTGANETESESGVVMESQYRAFSVVAADLPRQPERGSNIIWDGTTYVVVHPAGGRVWSWEDHDKRQYKIHAELAPRVEGPESSTSYGNHDGVEYGNHNGTAYGKPG